MVDQDDAHPRYGRPLERHRKRRSAHASAGGARTGRLANPGRDLTLGPIAPLIPDFPAG